MDFTKYSLEAFTFIALYWFDGDFDCDTVEASAKSQFNLTEGHIKEIADYCRSVIDRFDSPV